MSFFKNETVESEAKAIEDICKVIKETDRDSFEARCSLEQTLTFKTAEEDFKKYEVDFDITKMKSLGLVSADNRYSNVGFLLSDQCTSTIKAATFEGTDPYIFHDGREFDGSLLHQMAELYAYLDLRNHIQSTIEGLHRIDTRDYPEEALREVLMNFIIHRDYSYSASALVRVYETRIEFVSIGGVPAGITLEDIMLGLSVCRNPKLATVFYCLKLVEAYGTGLSKIMKAYKGSGLNPKIEVTNNAFKITLPNRNTGISQDEPVNRPEDTILDYLKDHDFIFRNELDRLLQISQTTSSRLLRRMVDEGLIRQDGVGRKTKFRKK